jgi:hypothetical protein
VAQCPVDRELRYDTAVVINYTFWLISYRRNKNYLLDGGDWLRLVYEHSDGRLHVDGTRR